MEIPLVLVLIIYLVAIFIFAIFTFFNLYHAWRFGMNNLTNFITMGLYILALIVLFILSFNFISKINWGTAIGFGF